MVMQKVKPLTPWAVLVPLVQQQQQQQDKGTELGFRTEVTIVYHLAPR